MILRFLVKYMISDFLIDQKKEMKILEVKLRDGTLTKEDREGMESLLSYLYKQGLQAMNKYDREVPGCVKAYYLGNRQKPTKEKITKDLSLMSVHYGKINHKIAYIVVATLVTLLLILAFL